jgi:hypothetical protein
MKWNVEVLLPSHHEATLQQEMDVSNQRHALADFTRGRWAPRTRQQREESPPLLPEAEHRSASP